MQKKALLKNFLQWYLFAILFILQRFSAQALAEEGDRFYINKLNYCQLTKSSQNDYEPKVFSPTNNLLRKTGHQVMTCGQKIIIKGRVLDANCVPVSDAKVYLWQVGCDGKYPYETLKPKVDQALVNTESTASFLGNGTASTDNNGVFYFVTILPPSHPHVNVRVKHYKLGRLQTSLKLTKQHISDEQVEHNDPLYGLLTENLVYNFDIVLSGVTTKSY
jgi:protocatechuate 3,4-dioxygenase beta subunit